MRINKFSHTFLIFPILLLLIQGVHAEWETPLYGDDTSIWIALFGLAIIGIFSLYISSEKIKDLTRGFADMQASQKEIETRQGILLGVIGERLETSTHGIRRHRELFEEHNGKPIDWDVIRNEMTRFRRDEHLLHDAMQDLQDFSQIRSGSLRIEPIAFDLAEMLKRLSHQVEPHYFLKRNELVYRFDPQQLAQITGDARRIEQILGILLTELGQGIYDSTVILAMRSIREDDQETVLFDLQVPQSNESIQMPDELLIEDVDLMQTQHSSRRLKSYLARELIRLMGGTLTPVLEHKEGIHYRITLPLRVEAAPDPVALPDTPLLIVTHNEPSALSIRDMLEGRLAPGQMDVHVSGDTGIMDLSLYETVIITYRSLQAGWSDRLREAQREYPLRLIVLKNGFERNQTIPEDLQVTRTLRMPLLPEKIAKAMLQDPNESFGYDVAAS